MPMEFKQRKGCGLNFLKATSVECCGWIQISGFMNECDELDYDDYNEVYKDLAMISSESWIVPTSMWSRVSFKPTKFVLHCVLSEVQQPHYEDALAELGWQALPSFLNPNTDNRCYPYMFIPKHLE